MIPAFIVLLVIAFALGGYIAFDVLYAKKKAAVVDTEETAKCGEELKAALAEQNGITEKPSEEADCAENYHYETTEALIERKLIKELTDEDDKSGTVFGASEVRGSVTAQEADRLMRDEVAATLIEKSDEMSDRTKQSVVNIDTLSQCFESGEVVTLEEIKKRVKGFNKQTTYLKVLERGTLNKALTVEADSFSLQAVKMIVLTGGTAFGKRQSNKSLMSKEKQRVQVK